MCPHCDEQLIYGDDIRDGFHTSKIQVRPSAQKGDSVSHAKTLEPGVVSLLSEVLAGLPNLSGAACVDADPRLFDGWLPRERSQSFDVAKAPPIACRRGL